MIIDSHVHLITTSMVEAVIRRFENFGAGVMERSLAKGRGVINQKMISFLAKQSLESLADLWVAELDAHDIDRALFLPIAGAAMSEIDDFVSLRPDRFSGYLFLDDPASGQAAATARHWIGGRIRGIKLYPSLSHFSVADKSLFPLYEEAAALGAPILIHFGISNAPIADYRYTNPLDLQLPLKLFPDTKFVIAHFGAGFFREVLLLGFHTDNLWLDTSGTNNWRQFLPEVMPLATIFRRAIEVFGAQKILYGTDTALNGATGYRAFVLQEQRDALDQLDLTPDDKEMIMGKNATRLFGLDQ